MNSMEKAEAGENRLLAFEANILGYGCFINLFLDKKFIVGFLIEELVYIHSILSSLNHKIGHL